MTIYDIILPGTKNVSEEEYKRVNNSSSYNFHNDISYSKPEFSFNEIQKFLNKKGYDVIIHKVLRNQRQSNDYSSWEIPNVQIEVIIAVKPGDYLPERWETPSDYKFEAIAVFRNEFKQILLNL